MTTKGSLNISAETSLLLAKLQQELAPPDLSHWNVEGELARIQASCADQSNFDSVIRTARESIGRITQISSAFETVARRLEELNVRKFRFSSSWWEQERAAIERETDESVRLEKWARVVAEAVEMSEPAVLSELLERHIVLPPAHAGLAQLCSSGVQAIVSDRYDDPTVKEMLTALIELRMSPGSQPVVDAALRADLLVFRGRIDLYRKGTPETALNDFQEAHSIAPQACLPLAALGEYRRKLGDRGAAEGFFQQGILIAPDLPYGYLGMGLSAEDQNRWDEADGWFDRTADRVLAESQPLVAFGRMLAPVSGNAYLRLARKLENLNPELALDAVNRAELLGVGAAGNNPARLVFAAKADILLRLDRRLEAAEAYFNAGRLFHWDDDPNKAIELLEKARLYNNTHAPTHWTLADAYTIFSYRAQSDDEKKIRLSLAQYAWESGMLLSRPEVGQYWTYLTRALMCEQLASLAGVDWKAKARLYWQALASVEQSLVLQNERALSWALLTRYFRLLQLESHALEASQKGAALDPSFEDLTLLEETLIILANAGQTPQAEAMADKYLSRMPGNVWAKQVKAFIKYNVGLYADAISLINETQGEPDVWALEIRAVCHARLANQEQAGRDWQQLLERAGKQDVSHGFAAYQLALYDEALETLEPLLSNPFERSLANRHLATCWLLRGDVTQAWNYVLETVRLSNERELREWFNVDLVPIRDRIPQRTFEQIAAGVDGQLQKLAQIPRLSDEMARARQELNPDTPEHSWSWVAAEAASARAHSAEGHVRDAITIYQRLLDEPPLGEDRLPPFAEAEAGIATQFETYYGLAGLAGLYPLVTPIALELSPDLVPSDTSDEAWPLLKTYIPDMRQKILRDMDINVPGVRVRVHDSIDSTSGFAVLINDCPVVSWEIVDLKDGDPDPWFAIVRRLDIVIRSNLAEFIGLQEIENILENWRKDPTLVELVDAALPDPPSRIRFTRLVRALVREQAPLTRPADVLRSIMHVGLSDEIADSLREVRLRLRSQLPGNRPDIHSIDVPPDLETAMWIWLSKADGRQFVAAPPEDVAEWLGQLRPLIAATPADVPQSRTVLVTNDPDLRLPVRKLVDLEFPDVLVMSREERLEQQLDVSTLGAPIHA
jgi:hypothetical protein